MKFSFTSNPAFSLLRLLPLVALVSTAHATEFSPFWREDFEGARKDAAAAGKDLLVDFTGSDWCAWCIRLHKEVFDLPAFPKGIESRFVAVELDYPKDPARVTEQVRTQNEALLKRYPIKGYPTVLLCDTEGKPYAATGYQPGGPEKYLATLETLQAKKAARDKGLAEAAGKQGVEKARQLIATLEGLELDPAMVAAHYGDVQKAIREADPKDETGYTGKQTEQARLNEFLQKLGERRGAGDTEGALALIRETLADPTVKGELRQQVHGHHAGTLAYANRKEEAIQVLEAAVKEAPEGTRTTELSQFIDILKKEIARTAGTPAPAPAPTPAPAETGKGE